MRYLIYLGHPAQYHFFKRIISNLQSQGHAVKVLIKTKDILEQLLQEDGVEYVNIQPVMRKNSKLAIFMAMLQRVKAVVRVAKEFNADVLVGEDASLSWSSMLLHKDAISVLEDDYEVIKNEAILAYPWAKYIVVPQVCSVGPFDKKKIGYEGYMKLAYLHPNYFQPKDDVCISYGILPQNKYILMRLARLTAFHDTNIKGLNRNVMDNVIAQAESRGYRVYISSENELDEQLSIYQLHIKHTDVHHIMANASLLISDSQSMSVEAAMLGVPSLRFSDFTGRIRVLEELEHKYQLTFGIKTSNPEMLLTKADELLRIADVRATFHKRRDKMLHDKIDVTAFFTWLLANYPQSTRQVNQLNFNWKTFK